MMKKGPMHSPLVLGLRNVTYHKEKTPSRVLGGGDHVITSVIVGFTDEQDAVAFIHHFFAPSDAHDCRLYDR
jgi:hypothetical protein